MQRHGTASCIRSGRGGLRHGAGGWTLIEMLVALALTALLLVGMPSTLRLAARALGLAEGLGREADDRAALDLVGRALSQALPMYERGPDGRLQVLFSGAPAALAFVAPARIGPESGLFRLELTMVPPSAGADQQGRPPGLWLAWSLYRPPETDDSPPPARLERRLIADARSLSIRYFGAIRSRQEPEWSTSWTVPDTIPDLVEITIATPRSDQGLDLQIRVPLRLKPAQ